MSQILLIHFLHCISQLCITPLSNCLEKVKCWCHEIFGKLCIKLQINNAQCVLIFLILVFLIFDSTRVYTVLQYMVRTAMVAEQQMCISEVSAIRG